MGAERIGIVGAGRMGVPMAFALACAGFAVDLADLKPRSDADWNALCRQVHADWEVAGQLLVQARVWPAGAAPAWQQIALRRGCGPWLEGVGCLFEALPESAELKAGAYRAAGTWLRPDCLIGTTTSSFAPDELAAHVPHPERFLVTHWLHPPWLMPLVEVARGTATAPKALETMVDLLRRAGKVPVKVAGTPGLLVARLQIPIMNAAAELAADGVAPPATIDQAVRLGLGFRFLVQGLLEFADTGGIDVLYLAGRHLRTALNDSRFEPGPAVAGRVERGELGRKSGRGFYDWTTPAMQQQGATALRTYLQLLDLLGLAPGVPSLPLTNHPTPEGACGHVATGGGGGATGNAGGPAGRAPATADSAAVPPHPLLPAAAEEGGPDSQGGRNPSGPALPPPDHQG